MEFSYFLKVCIAIITHNCQVLFVGSGSQSRHSIHKYELLLVPTVLIWLAWQCAQELPLISSQLFHASIAQVVLKTIQTQVIHKKRKILIHLLKAHICLECCICTRSEASAMPLFHLSDHSLICGV